MKYAVTLCAALALGLSFPVVAQQAPAPKPAQPKVADAAAAGDVVTLTAKIDAVDTANRTVTVTGPLGRTVTLKVDERVKNFAQVKAGDEIVLKYAEAGSVALVKGGGGRSETTTTTGPVTAPAGAKPGAAMAQQTKIVAKVERVDEKRQVVLLEGPKGGYAEVKVKDPAVFNNVKVGDNVEVTYTEAVVIDVVTPKKEAGKAEPKKKKGGC
jgi:predicted Rdx family selenoprotein